MRLAGWFFLLAGLVLCLSVVWATVGFLMMGIGLIALQAAERRRRRSPDTEAVPREPVLHAPGQVPSKVSDTARWRQLVQSDPEISQLVAILAAHGPSHVEEFAADYLAVNDKDALPAIVDRIIARARLGAATAEPSVGVAPREPSPEAEPAPAPRDDPATAPASHAHAPNVVAIAAVAPEKASAPAQPDVAPVLAGAESVEAEAPKAEPLKAEIAGSEPSVVAAQAAAGNASAAQAEARPDAPPDVRTIPQDRPATIASADDNLAELFEKFAPDSGFLTRGFGARKPV